MAKTYQRNGVWYGTADDMVLMIEKQKIEIERLRALVLIGDVRCEQCGEPATTLDVGDFASCADCAGKAPTGTP